MELEPGLVVDDVLLEVDAAGGLLGDGGRDAGVGMAGVRHPDAARVVEIAFAVDGLDPGPRGAFDDEVGIARPDRRNPGAQRRPVGQNVGGVLIHSNLVSSPASLRQRCGRFDGKLNASPGSRRRYVSSSPTQTVSEPESR